VHHEWAHRALNRCVLAEIQRFFLGTLRRGHIAASIFFLYGVLTQSQARKLWALMSLLERSLPIREVLMTLRLPRV
jgi:hypothetical protein